MATEWWPDAPRFPRDKADLPDMDFCAFEKFTVEVLRLYYARHHIAILGGKCRPDGGRDGEGDLVVGATEAFPELGATFRIWLEAKHWSRSVDPNTALGHLAAAFIEHVDKIVFVSSGPISSGARKQGQDFARKAGLDCTFLSGERLLEVARFMGLPEGEETDGAGERPSREPCHQTVADRPRWSASGQFLLNRWQLPDPGSAARSLQLAPEEPAYLALTVDAGLLDRAQDATFSIICPSGWTCWQLDARETRTVAAGDTIALTAALFPPPTGSVAIKDFSLAIEDAAGSQILRLGGSQRCTVAQPVLMEELTEDQARVSAAVMQVYRDWSSQPGVATVLVQAPAGHGKSFLLRRWRREWLQDGGIEILLDCETSRTPDHLLAALISRLFPVDLDHLSAENENVVRRWMEGRGLGAALAAKVASGLCGLGALPPSMSPGMKAQLTAVTLAAVAERRPVVLVLDDLHKAAASLVSLLRDLRQQLVGRNVPVFLVTTSRHVALEGTVEARSHWEEEMAAFRAAEWVRDQSFGEVTEEWATARLRATFPELTPADAAGLLRQVGREPFNLVEALRYLASPQCQAITLDPHIGRHVLLRPSALHEPGIDEGLREPTAHRLQSLLAALPPWATTIVQGAALYGRVFARRDLSPFIPDVDADLDAVLGVLEREGVVASSPFILDDDCLQFSHDLIRRAVLQAYSRPGNLPQLRRVAATLLGALAPGQGGRHLPMLTYAAGNGGPFLQAVEAASRHEADQGRPADAVPLLLKALDTIDPKRLPLSFNQGRGPRNMDDVFQFLPPPAYRWTGSHQERERTILRLLLEIVAQTTAVSSGSAEIVERAAQEALAIAAFLGDVRARLQVLPSIARMWIQRGAPDKSLATHEDIQKEIDAAPGVLSDAERADAMTEQAIALRLTGNGEASRRLLDEAMPLAAGQARLQHHILCNVGALYFYTDAVQRRRYWMEALEVARSAGYTPGQIHSTLDLVSLDILEDDLTSASSRAREALNSAEELGLENMLLRGSYMMGAIQLLEGAPDTALRHLHRAEELAILHSVDRRLWKARGNMGTAHELRGEMELCYIADRQALERAPELQIALAEGAIEGQEKRVTIIVGNIALRARTSKPHAELLSTLPERWQAVARDLVTAADAVGTSPRQGFPYEHCKMVGGQPRYVMT